MADDITVILIQQINLQQVDSEKIRLELERLLGSGNFSGAADFLKKFDSLETNVVLFALRQYHRGAPDHHRHHQHQTL